MKFQRIHEGLISNRVSAIYQDRFGSIWIGTYSGLHRYDGIEFHVYSTGPESNSISDNYIGDIFEDTHKNLWIGTGNGLARYNRDTNDFTRFNLPGSSQTQGGESTLINTILEDKNGTLWVSGSGRGVFYFDRDLQQFIPYEGLEIFEVNSITIDDKNNLWVATSENGLGRLNLDTNHVTYFTHDPDNSLSISSNFVSQVRMDSEGTLWIGTNNSGLNKMVTEGEKIIFRRYQHEQGNPNSLGNNNIFTLYIDRTENLWVGNENGGLHLYDKKNDSFFHYDSDPNDPNSLSHNSIWSIFQDNQGRYWIGTAQSGVNVADQYHSKFAGYSKTSGTENGLNNDIVRDFLVDDDNNIWIATDGGGLNYFDRTSGNFTAYEHDSDNPYSLSSNAVIVLKQDEQKNLWVGTWDGGLDILTDKQNGRFTSFKDQINNHSYPIQNIFDVHFDEQHIWVAAFDEGLYKYSTIKEELELFSHVPDNPLSLSSNFIIRIYEDSSGNLWIATLEGLNVLLADDKEKGIFQRYFNSNQDSSSVAGHSIRQIFEDRNQNIWIATDAGLSRYIKEDNSFKSYYQSDGLPANEIRSVIEDDNGDLWIGTIKGLSRFDPKDKTFANFDKSDGLQSNEFSRYSVQKTHSGELLFGGLSGFNLFHPNEIKNNPVVPPVYLTDFKLFNKSVDIRDPDSPLQKHISVTDTLVLSHQEDVITFEFIALNYTRSEYNQYAYIVEGFEEDWNYVGTQRNATYTNLDPGKYIFRVKASNNDGVWNEEGASLVLIITPPFWQTTWFNLLSALFIIGVIFSVYRYRVQSIREHNQLLEQQVAERTDELKEKNRDLKTALKELKSTKNELVEKAHKAGMADIATGVLHNVGNILTSVNTSASLIEDTAKQSKVDGLVQANIILREHIGRIEEFIANNPQGKNLLAYYLKLEEPLKNERENLLRQSKRLIEKIELINEVIAAQQNYAGAGMHAEVVSLPEIIDNALALQAGSIDRHNLTVTKHLQATQPVIAHRSKLIHVLVNIFKNAKEAMEDLPPEEKKITIKVWQDKQSVYLSITDNGPGIKSQHMDKIFTQGFTTKKKGHGFGLHSSANYIKEMNGNISVKNGGEKKGATFSLNFKKAAK